MIMAVKCCMASEECNLLWNAVWPVENVIYLLLS